MRYLGRKDFFCNFVPPNDVTEFLSFSGIFRQFSTSNNQQMDQNRQQQQLPRKFYKLTAQVIYMVVLPAFFLLFVLGYRPEGLVGLLDMGLGMFSFNLTMVFVIIFGSVFVLRLSLYFLRHMVSHHPLWYLAWCILELVVISFFVALYIWLVYDGTQLSYYEALGSSMGYIFSILFYPYVVIFLLQLVEANSKFLHRHSGDAKKTESRIKFTDDNGQVRFTALTNDILYIEAEGNYIRIHYLSRNEKKSFSLRNSMKNIEAKCEEYALARCHRSYFINPKRVKLLTKGDDGILYAELNDLQSTHVPITKTYYDKLTNML